MLFRSFEADDGFAVFAQFAGGFDAVGGVGVDQAVAVLINGTDGGEAVGMGRFGGNEAVFPMSFSAMTAMAASRVSPACMVNRVLPLIRKISLTFMVAS